MEKELGPLSALFEEGRIAYLGEHEGKPITIWMNKLNSFETEEAKRDASVRRHERLAELTDDSAEVRGARAEMALWSDQELVRAIVESLGDELFSEALDNLQSQEGWLELEDYVRRAPAMLEDDDIQPGDPRFETLEKKTGEYTGRLRAEEAKVRREREEDLTAEPREKLEARFMKEWRDRRTTAEWIEAKRISELFLSARVCQAARTETLAEEILWDHSGCDHSQRFYTARANVRKTPDGALARIVEAYENMRMSPRDVGNSDAPGSSSESLEPSSTAEGPSTPSFQEGTPVAAVTT